ncbi:MAG: aldehyde dehydrogenase [Deltaproteobacteria bacterium RIFCSPLOWO2_01_44_7]|nr:MAG: aldehyde dehydrogenase [Deltaproteobacteria bacterium RIFCSPHIGHO2_01_FULL_43_49]OGQ15928.1 MAG: aldehyde dehydrogenase [Deltaproteobacteria bacterium RIFCSPHIGHO2_02_FULL_44_53]OGQ28890.1 MAG: aldehyde dehydrogenase [Deltaproteobacteria bacterium RIFCSPHIGHO2_12_FULL_44_21]OGQ30982.1 MAG: aldehyde dehydrogenase [Deltaproteobacteria bacterium RIFCSPLOWO2_01_FULL_45_74]OGQ41519.1 MAG: aldehyde dehydrogenase [Deltaproteobacteria bacterium RIFCSPLOWO2_01_44_7]OGQ43488.1 MAG: aldehyde dehy
MRAEILKTYKLFINGQFPRSESGRYFQIPNPKTKKPLANVSQASRKDLRDAVQAARKALPGWSSKTAYNRGQILYRMAEVLESRKPEFIDEISKMTGNPKKAEKEVLTAIDRLVWYAGWSDKYQQILGTVNPVALPYFNFTLPEPQGVVGILVADELSLIPLVSKLAPAMVAGNTLVMIASEKFPLSAITFAEVIATSDVPAGVVNILTGFKNELIPHLAKHMDVNAVNYTGTDQALVKLLQEEGSANVKRIIAHPEPKGEAWLDNQKAQSPYWINSFVEMKTTWHPIGV